MAQFESCSVNKDDHGNSVKHTFQVVSIDRSTLSGAGVSGTTMMFCSQCGDAYVLSGDGQWHQITVGEPWHDKYIKAK